MDEERCVIITPEGRMFTPKSWILSHCGLMSIIS
ncbi:hypothetical protein L4D07_03860 [Photobacterium sanguinicancri]